MLQEATTIQTPRYLPRKLLFLAHQMAFLLVLLITEAAPAYGPNFLGGSPGL